MDGRGGDWVHGDGWMGMGRRRKGKERKEKKLTTDIGAVFIGNNWPQPNTSSSFNPIQ